MFDINKVKTPCFVVDEKAIVKNLELLGELQKDTGCHILLAQKAFSMFSIYPLIGKYLSGTTASGLYEARLGYEEMGKENHIFSPCYFEDEFDDILTYCDHIVFNSFSQWEKYKGKSIKAGRSCGIRINPQCSTQDGHAIYDPCSYGSRLGVTLENFKEEQLDGIEGLHFHTLCEQDSDALETTLNAVEEKFGKWLPKMKWINFGGGHHITKDGYDIDKLKSCIDRMKKEYGLEVYIEPGEAVVLNGGYLVSTVCEKVMNGIETAILDVSAACHMPDVIEMPYRPYIIGSGEANEKKYTYRLGGPTCLAGDVVGDYSFDKPLQIGDKLVFTDMALYTMVKTNTFNGMKLPSILLCDGKDNITTIKTFGYEDFRNRLS